MWPNRTAPATEEGPFRLAQHERGKLNRHLPFMAAARASEAPQVNLDVEP